MLGWVKADRRPDPLLDQAALNDSAVVANRAMNRERQLTGVNSYAAELGFDPLDFIVDRLAFDLITCVHGLHYVGDKLAMLTKAAGWLTETGMLVADFEMSSVRNENGLPAGRRLGNRLRSAGFSYDSRRHRITCTGRRTVSLPYAYLGADDRAGANYTGQPAVHSYYSER